MTLVSAGPVREHVLKLRAAGGTYESIGRAAGTGAMTVHCIANARRPTVQAEVARRLLAVSEADIRSMQPSPGGTMWRLRALVAMGHTCSRMAAATGIPPATLRRIVRGEALTISPAAAAGGHRAVRRLVGQDPAAADPPGKARRRRRPQTRRAQRLAVPGRARRRRARPARIPAAMRLAVRPRHRHRRRLPIRREEGRVMKIRPHGTEEERRPMAAAGPAELARNRPGRRTPSKPAEPLPDPAPLTWARAQLRERIQQAGAALAPTTEPADRPTREADRTPLADREPEP